MKGNGNGNVVVLGAGGHARVVVDAIRSQGNYHIAGVIDEMAEPGSLVLGWVPVLGPIARLAELASKHAVGGIVVAIGDNFVRRKVTLEALTLCPTLVAAVVVHPAATVAPSAALGPGTVVFAGAIVAPQAVVGQGCILNHKSSLDHDSEMGDFSALGPGATCSGGVKLGEEVWISAGATVIHSIAIGTNTVVGAGSCVVKNLPGDSLAYGVPARVVRSRKAGERFLRLYQSAGARVGWDAVEGESHLTALLRTLVLGALSRYGCLGTIEECRPRFAKMVAGEQVHPDLVTLVMVGAVRNGGASEYDAVLSMYRRHESAEQKLKCLQAMGATRDPALVERYLEWAMNSGDVRMGDVLYAFATLAGNPAGRQISWDWVVRNWAAVYGKFKDSHNLLSYICTLPLRGFSSHAMADEATKFFEDHQVPEARMAVDQSIEAMRAKASWLERDAGPIAAWLDANQ